MCVIWKWFFRGSKSRNTKSPERPASVQPSWIHNVDSTSLLHSPLFARSIFKIFRRYRCYGRIIQTCGLPQLAGASPVSSFWSCGFLLMLLQPLLQWHCSHFGFFLPQDKFTILYFSYGRFFYWWIIYSSSNWNDTIQRIFDKQMLFWNPNSSAFIISWIIPK